MNVTLLILVVSLSTIGSQLILKHGINLITPVLREHGAFHFLLSAAFSPYVIGALFIQVFGYVVWFFVLSQSRLSMSFAISGSFFYLLMAAASWAVFGERLNIWQWLGLSLISVGVLVLHIADGT